MFFTLQIPFADLRPFIAETPQTLFKRISTGESFEALEKISRLFVRSFGGFSSRKFTPNFSVVIQKRLKRKSTYVPTGEYWQQLKDLWSDEYCFARTQCGLLFPHLERHQLAGSKLTYPRAKVRSLHFSPYEPDDPRWSPSMRVEIGIHYDSEQSLNETEFIGALRHFLELPSIVPKYEKTEDATNESVRKVLHKAPLIGQSEALADLIVNATTPHREPRVHRSMVVAGAPLLTVHFFPNELDSIPENVVWMPRQASGQERIGYLPLQMKNTRVGVWLFELPDSREKRARAARRREIIRNYTIAVMRYWAELRAAVAVRRSVLEEQLGFSVRKDSLLERYITRSTHFLLKEHWHGANLAVIRNIVNAYEDLAEDAQIRRAGEALQTFNKQISTRALNFFRELGRVNVFVSYSHLDSSWRKVIEESFAELRDKKQIMYCDDTDLKPGEDWFRKIMQSIDTASIAVILVSNHFLQSDFIARYELPRIRELCQRHKLELIPVWIDGKLPKSSWISAFQLVTAERAPLAKANLRSRRHAIDTLALRVQEVSNRSASLIA